MGLPADPGQPPYEYGNDCAALIPDLWESGECPKYINAFFTGIDLCPDWVGKLATPIPNGETFTLTQSPGDACLWEAMRDNWLIQFFGNYFDTGNSALLLVEFTWGINAFIDQSTSQSQTSWSNTCTCALGYVGENGTGRIY